jgi:hypothetical protein
MSVTGQLVSPSVEILEFRHLNSLGNPVEALVREMGIVYVTALTRDGCSGCEEQKPLFRELANKMSSELSTKVHFANVHVRSINGDKTESWESKKLFRHAAYPTYLVHVKSGTGPLEVYRAIYPSMDELEKQVRESLELARFYKDEA